MQCEDRAVSVKLVGEAAGLLTPKGTLTGWKVNWCEGSLLQAEGHKGASVLGGSGQVLVTVRRRMLWMFPEGVVDVELVFSVMRVSKRTGEIVGRKSSGKEMEERKMTSGPAKGLSFIRVPQYQAHSRCFTNISELRT